MKRILILISLPFFAKAQTDTTIIYSKNVTTKARVHDVVQFVREQRSKFFYLNSYSKRPISNITDTSRYGTYIMKEDTIIAKCMFIYFANNVDVVYGDVAFFNKADKAYIQLQNVIYSKYEQKNGQWQETQRGLYKDLKLCRHCNVTGIKIGETVNKGFVRLSLAYENYLKTAQKNYSKELLLPKEEEAE